MLEIVYLIDMVFNLIENIMAVLFIPGFVLHILHYGWFKKYTSLLLSLLYVVAGVLYGAVLATPKAAIGLIKTALVALVTVILILVYSATFIVPYIGKEVSGRRESMKNRIELQYFTIRVRRMRDLMVRIVAEEDDRNLKFEEPDEYRAEFSKVKQDAKNRLETGETLLSVLLGSILLLANLVGLGLLRTSIYGVSTSFLIEAWLLVIAVSIIYRSSVLEFLTYSPEQDFNSLEKMDAALSYQKGISLVGFMQGLTFLVVFVAAISRIRFEIIETVLRAKYLDKPWIDTTWEQLHN